MPFIFEAIVGAIVLIVMAALHVLSAGMLFKETFRKSRPLQAVVIGLAIVSTVVTIRPAIKWGRIAWIYAVEHRYVEGGPKPRDSVNSRPLSKNAKTSVQVRAETTASQEPEPTSFIITNGLYSLNLPADELGDDTVSVCVNSKIEITSVVNKVIPLSVGEYGTDNVSELGTIKAGEKLTFTVSSVPGDYIIANAENYEQSFFSYETKACGNSKQP